MKYKVPNGVPAIYEVSGGVLERSGGVLVTSEMFSGVLVMSERSGGVLEMSDWWGACDV